MRLPLAAVAMAAACGAMAQEPAGRVLVSVGVCKDSIAEHPVVWFRKVDQSAHFNAGGAAFGLWDYSDDTGKFAVRTKMLPAGEWEMFRYEVVTQEPLGRRTRHRPRNDYSHRFTVEPGKLVDLGRYCAATQTTGEVYPDSDKVWNQVARLTYLHVSANREADVEGARKPEGGGALLEVVQARPDPPERLTPLLRSRFIEPRVIGKRVPSPSQPDFPR